MYQNRLKLEQFNRKKPSGKQYLTFYVAELKLSTGFSRIKVFITEYY